MANPEPAQVSAQSSRGNPGLALIRKARLLEALTFVAVVLVSPVSFILGLPLGISPHDWLSEWTHWTFVFITVAIVIALLGFEAALSFRLKAERLSKAAPT